MKGINDQRYLQLAMALAMVAGNTLLLTGCSDHSVSGSYLSHSDNQAAFLQITETPDHHLTGTIHYVSLVKGGIVSSGNANVSGVVAGSSISMTVLALQPAASTGKNFGGVLTNNGIDFTVSTGAQTRVEHFSKGKSSDFDAIVAQLSKEGLRFRQIEQLDRRANALADSINRFVGRANYWLEHLPRASAYYTQAIKIEQAKLDHIQRLIAMGNNVARGQAGVVVGQMNVDKSQIEIVENGFYRDQKEDALAESTINAGIAQWQGNCLAVKPGDVIPDVIPDMGPCKMLSHAVDSYNAILPQLHGAFAAAEQAKAQGHAQLVTIWQKADRFIN